MTLDQLKYFETAAQTLHIGRAAQLLNISQPSLSISIKKLEAELEVPLFQPEGRGIALTSYGRELLPYARSILQQTQAAKDHLKKKADKLNMEIHFAYTASIAYLCVPRLFRNFMAASKEKYLIYSDEMPSGHLFPDRTGSGYCPDSYHLSAFCSDPSVLCPLCRPGLFLSKRYTGASLCFLSHRLSYVPPGLFSVSET